MTREQNRYIADAKRAARRLARTRTETYQECLDIVAKNVGMRNWGAFLQDPVDVRKSEDDEAITIEIPLSYDVDFTAVDPSAPPPAPAPPRVGFKSGGGEGIVLGADDDLRLVRSSRQSLVVCIGEEMTGKTTGVVMPTIATSPHASQIINDGQSGLMRDVIHLGCRSHTRMVKIDPMGSIPGYRAGGVDTLSFNPLHPAFRLPDEHEHGHAVRVANQMLPRPKGGRLDYFNEKGRGVLAAFMAYLMVVPDTLPDRYGSRRGMASIPAVVDWMTDMIEEAREKGFNEVFETMIGRCSGCNAPKMVRRLMVQDVAPLINMAPNERSGVLGTVDKGLLMAKNREMARYLDPEDEDSGGDLARAFGDPDRPATAFLCNDVSNIPILAIVNALAVDCIGQIRAVQGPSSRSLQIILDEAADVAPIRLVQDAFQDGAPAGISMLVVDRRADPDRLERLWVGENLEEARANHVIVLGTPPKTSMETIASLSAGSIGETLPPIDAGRHVVGTDGEMKVLVTPYLHAPRSDDM